MPVALAPSNVFATVSDLPPMTTEAKASYVDYKAYEVPAPRPYRVGPPTIEPDQVINKPQNLLVELGALGARLEAMSTPTAPTTQPPASAPAADEDPAALEGAVPWEGSTYDTFAKYAGEASRVRNTGRLPFGSDNKKMQI